MARHSPIQSAMLDGDAEWDNTTVSLDYDGLWVSQVDEFGNAHSVAISLDQARSLASFLNERLNIAQTTMRGPLQPGDAERQIDIS